MCALNIKLTVISTSLAMAVRITVPCVTPRVPHGNCCVSPGSLVTVQGPHQTQPGLTPGRMGRVGSFCIAGMVMVLVMYNIVNIINYVWNFKCVTAVAVSIRMQYSKDMYFIIL